ncbi:ABC transporter substrate-binding protein [Photobacterium carnosum]|uniref:Probable sugar-binding periplasmic protein n=1 Tax=Photobacterium carnosum TaxID=2023717 RepID=A0A2N4UV01_9GAMM|nr:ABC transporter substrate-binding protein [Photobacterium carnosum]KAE8177551.1 sugar ABC transporter substrate-binding protein [Photobacterium carnosum]MCD9536251.1 extracellular solute-binding protein [Photobacterium carnosum]MCD9539922.1 extracellular solute-binding protein [Photobacterium carnosum]MCF2160639.1 extracellular solute-binding protein [Photobacterium carnosum]PLC58837.1 sugar ABC transporter substrate-binding protein [Photobacterium carnosum]
MKLKYIILTFVLSLLFAIKANAAGQVEVLHWWTSSGEAKSVKVLKHMMEQQGDSWKDFAVAGGGGESAMTVLKMRAVSGNPPTAAQLKGHDIQEWGRLGFLTSLDDVAQQEHWDNVLPPVVANIMKYNNHYVAVPINVHRVNWLWVNPTVFKAAGATVPTTLAEFFVAADKIKAAGFIALAHGGQPWQDATLFESIALAVLGSADYRKAFVDLNMTVINSVKMVDVFKQFKRMKAYIDPEAEGRHWNSATEMVINGQAAMQFMGDWAKGEFAQANKQAGKDYLCVPAPGTQHQFTFNIDSLAFFKLKGTAADNVAQHDLAKILLTPYFQRVFNLNKGSIPVRLDMDMSAFDQCALDSMKAFKQASLSGDLVPSFSQNLATTADVQSAIVDVVSEFFNQKNPDPELAPSRLARAIKSAI